ncbi:MAG: hypothetical protein ACRD8K_01895, partial [Nitrososphaeraceae archaeon]
SVIIMLESATTKRTIMCGLVLMTSLLLIILTITAVPFVNMKVFTNAMAVVIDPSINDTSQNYGGYSNTLKNDSNNNKYQLQSNNNDNSNYDDKKMSSYNSNYDDKNSKYPIRDKIHVCQSGPFEGFFVSSVEFCDLRSSHR